MSISFAAWKDGAVAPTRHVVSVINPKAGIKSEPVSARWLRTMVHPQRKAGIPHVRFLDDGKKLFIAGYPSGVIQLFDPSTGAELRRIESPPGARGSLDVVAATRDGSTLYVANERTKAVSTQKDGKTAPRWEYGGEVLVWDFATGKALPSLKTSAPDRAVSRVYLAPGGDKLLTVETFAGTVEGRENAAETLLWDLKSGRATSIAKGDAMGKFSADGKLVAAAVMWGEEDGLLRIVDAGTGKKRLDIPAPTKGWQFSFPLFSPSADVVAVQENEGHIHKPAAMRVYDVKTGKELAAFPSAGSYPFFWPSMSPDGRWLAACDYDGTVNVWDVAGRKLVWTHSTKEPRSALRIAFSPDSRRLAVIAQSVPKSAGDDPDPEDLPQPRVLLFETARGGEPEVIVCPHGRPGALAFSPDGRLLAVGGAGAVHLFDVSK